MVFKNEIIESFHALSGAFFREVERQYFMSTSFDYAAPS